MTNEIKNEAVATEETVKGLQALFGSSNRQVFGGGNQLSKTAELTQHAETLAKEALEILNGAADDYEQKVVASFKNHDTMDDLIGEILELSAEDVDYLKEVSKEELEKMIRSQQSKRSRTKSKEFTLENYKTMLVGAISENLLRIAGDMPKSSGGGRIASPADYTDEKIEELKSDVEKLKKAIRNVQSKKSIMSHKEGFDETSDAYQALLEEESFLKSLRDGSTANEIPKEAKEAIESNKMITELLAGMDDNLSDDELRARLESMKEMLLTK